MLRVAARVSGMVGHQHVSFFNGLFDSVNAKRTKPSVDELLTREPAAICSTFARNLRFARKAAGLSRRALSEAADVSERHIWLIETSAFNVTLETVSALAKQLGKTPLEMLIDYYPNPPFVWPLPIRPDDH